VTAGEQDARNPRYKYRALLGAIRMHQPSGRLLDIGCGSGRFLEVVAQEGGYEQSGIDLSDLQAEFSGEAFDVVTMFDVLQRAPDLPAALAAARARLRPNGILAISVPVYDGPVGILVDAMDTDPLHLQKLGREEWVGQCQANGLRVLRWTGIVRTFLAGKVALHVQSRRLRRVSPAILVLATPA
jgi:SAM-dependent methyltransferase